MSSLAVTYIRGFVVSTIDRDSSAAVVNMRYAETLVWEWDEETRKRGQLVAQDEDGEGSIRAHQTMVERIHLTGKPCQTECDHEWLDMRNEITVSGEMCRKCGHVRAGNQKIPKASA